MNDSVKKVVEKAATLSRGELIQMIIACQVILYEQDMGKIQKGEHIEASDTEIKTSFPYSGELDGVHHEFDGITITDTQILFEGLRATRDKANNQKL